MVIEKENNTPKSNTHEEMIEAIIIADGYEVTQFLAPAVLGYFAYWMSKEMAVLNNPMHTIVPLLVFCVIVIAISMANTDQLKQWDDIASEKNTKREIVIIFVSLVSQYSEVALLG